MNCAELSDTVQLRGMRHLHLRLLILLLLMPFAAPSAEVALLPPDRAWEEAQSGQVLIIDVRNAAEWAWTGVPRGAARASWWQIGGESGFLEDVLAIVGHERDRAIALICASGVRSSNAAAFLRANGFSNVRDIGEGMLGSAAGPGWLKRQLPLE